MHNLNTKYARPVIQPLQTDHRKSKSESCSDVYRACLTIVKNEIVDKMPWRMRDICRQNCSQSPPEHESQGQTQFVRESSKGRASEGWFMQPRQDPLLALRAKISGSMPEVRPLF